MDYLIEEKVASQSKFENFYMLIKTISWNDWSDTMLVL